MLLCIYQLYSCMMLYHCIIVQSSILFENKPVMKPVKCRSLRELVNHPATTEKTEFAAGSVATSHVQAQYIGDQCNQQPVEFEDRSRPCRHFFGHDSVKLRGRSGRRLVLSRVNPPKPYFSLLVPFWTKVGEVDSVSNATAKKSIGMDCSFPPPAPSVTGPVLRIDYIRVVRTG